MERKVDGQESFDADEHDQPGGGRLGSSPERGEDDAAEVGEGSDVTTEEVAQNLTLKWLETERERVLFNDALNTFYLRLYGVRHMVKDHSDSERGNPLPPHRLLLSISSKGSFICTIPQTG